MLRTRSLAAAAVLLGALLVPVGAASQTKLADYGLVIENQNSADFDGYGGTPFGQLYIFETRWTPVWPIRLTTYTYMAIVYCRRRDEDSRPPSWSLSHRILTGPLTKRNNHYVLPYVFGAKAGGVMDIDIAGGVFSQTGSGAAGGDMGIPFADEPAPDDMDDAALLRLPQCPD